MVLSPESFIHLDQKDMTEDERTETLLALHRVPFQYQATEVASCIYRSLGFRDIEDLGRYIDSMEFNDPGETVALDFETLQALCA